MPRTMVVEDFGVMLGVKSERLVVRKDKKVIEDVPLFQLAEIVVPERGTCVSSDLIRAACERGIRFVFGRTKGSPFALLTSPLMVGTVEVRRAQILAGYDRRGVALSTGVVGGKIGNQAKLLRYFGKSRRTEDARRYDELASRATELEQLRERARALDAPTPSEIRGELLAIEGAAGRLYWSGVRALLDGRIAFPGRTGRGAVDRSNALLNYGYGILYGHVWGALLNAGLEPYAGFLHTDRPGKPSLVLDMVEEFRQPVVDRAVLTLLIRGEHIELEENGGLAISARRRLAEVVTARLSEEIPFRGERRLVRSVIQSQARALAGFLVGRSQKYRPYAFKW